jgi:hypothetical protein
MTLVTVRRAVAAIVAAACLAIPAAALADDPAQTARDRERVAKWERQQAQKESTWPPTDFRGGDNPVDHPGMSRAPEYDAPTTIEVVRPERTIVRDVDEALPLILSGTALALVLASLGFALIRMRPVPRPGRSN